MGGGRLPVFRQRSITADQAFVARDLIHFVVGRDSSNNSSSGVILIRSFPERHKIMVPQLLKKAPKISPKRRCDDPNSPYDAHQGNTDFKEARVRTWLLFQAPDDRVLPAHDARRTLYI